MSRNILVITTAFSMLLHAALGCCVHHVHASETQQGKIEATTLRSCCHAHRGDQKVHGKAMPLVKLPCCAGTNRHRWPSPCHETDCSFVSAERHTKLVRTQLVEATASTFAEAEALMQPSHGFCTVTCDPAGAIRTSLATRCQQQVWQI